MYIKLTQILSPTSNSRESPLHIIRHDIVALAPDTQYVFDEKGGSPVIDSIGTYLYLRGGHTMHVKEPIEKVMEEIFKYDVYI